MMRRHDEVATTSNHPTGRMICRMMTACHPIILLARGGMYKFKHWIRSSRANLPPYIPMILILIRQTPPKIAQSTSANPSSPVALVRTIRNGVHKPVINSNA